MNPKRKKEKKKNVPSKPLTLDVMWTLDFYPEGLAIIKTRTIEKWKIKMQVVERLQVCKFCYFHFWYIIHPKKLGTCYNRSNVSIRLKIRGLYGSFWPPTLPIVLSSWTSKEKKNRDGTERESLTQNQSEALLKKKCTANLQQTEQRGYSDISKITNWIA
jgi:hypothetical protein